MELAKNTGEISTHNLDSSHIDPDRRIDTQHKFSDFNLSDLKPDIDRRIPVETKEQNELKELTPEQKDFYAQKLDWPISKFDNHRIDSNEVIHIKCRNEDLEGKKSEVGVPYVRKQFEINGVKLEGVFPKFEPKCEVTLSADELRSPFYAKLCNDKMGFDKTPDGYVWHHCEDTGKMQLVDQYKHEHTPHTGGASIWGCNVGKNGLKNEGVHF